VLPAIEKFSRINSLNFLDFQRRFDRTSNAYPATTVSGQSQAILHESETVFSCKSNCSQCFLPLHLASVDKGGHTVDKGCPFDPQFITTVRDLSDKKRVELIEQLCKRAQ